MRKASAIFILLWLGGAALAAVRTASVTGNWNDTATWGGAAVPATGDTANINGDIVVTVPVGVTANFLHCYIGVTANSTGIATLINNGTIAYDSGGTVRVGQGAGKDGKFTFGPSSTLTLTGGSLYLQNCYVTSNATRANPARVGGTGQLSTTGVTGPRQDLDFSNVIFQNTGTINVNLQDTAGVATSRFVMNGGAFIGTAAITIGATDSPNTTVNTLTNVDIRDIAGTRIIIQRRATGGDPATIGMFYCSVYNSGSAWAINPTTCGGITITGCVLIHGKVTAVSTSSALIYTYNLASYAASSANVLMLSDAGPAATISNNYFVETGNNLHPILTSGSGGSGTHTISYNIMEGIVDGVTYTDRPDMLLPGLTPLAISFHHNLAIVTGNLVTGVTHPDFANGMDFYNNTIAGTISSALSVAGTGYQPEGAENVNGANISARSNLFLGNGSASDNAFQGASAGTTAQTIGYSDYNRFYNVANPYTAASKGLTVSTGNSGSPPSVPGSNDAVANPQFFAPTRSVGAWDGFFGSGTGTKDSAISYLLDGLNGYRGSANYDQNGTVMACTMADAFAWISYGYSPTNLALRAAGDPGDSSPDIGAMPVRAPAHGAFF